MNTTALKQFAQEARRQLREQVAARLSQVLRTDSVEIREKQKVVDELRGQIARSSQAAVIEKVAYTWFNRLCALRFMDVNHYTRVGIVSPVAGFTQPEILQEAKQGVIDESFPVDRPRIFDLLGGRIPAAHPQSEAYRLLLVGACNAYHRQMPFLFEPISDYTELLMPGDLLSENSILQAIRDALTPDTCRDVEVIGWLYQYYISERKDEVFANLKKNQKIGPEDIPAATQLFTPHWIVRYLVENSLGRLWLLNRPTSRLAEHMEFYIRPESPSPNPSQRDGDQNASLPPGGIEGGPSDFLGLSSPEEIKLCDPACGSGHLLTYAFDLLYRIYEEEGYDPVQIPWLILEKNLYGLELDPRAGDLAAFALTMKAREKDRRFFQRQVTPHICVLENVRFTQDEITAYMDAVGRDLFTRDLEFTLTQFEQADNFGSLIRPLVTDFDTIRGRLAEKGIFENLFLHATNQKVQQVLIQSEYLSPRYHVVLANPPYMGGKGMNDHLKSFLNNFYADAKSDLFSAFMVRNLHLTLPKGELGFVTPYVWMFISSYEKLRSILLSEKTIFNLVKPSYTSFFASAIVPLVTFVVKNSFIEGFTGNFIDLGYLGSAESQPIKLKEAIENPNCGYHYRASAADFRNIPGSPIAYWLSGAVFAAFGNLAHLGDSARVAKGMVTANNDAFVRAWQEVTFSKIGYNCKSREEAIKSSCKWFPYAKGGNFRRWSGNQESVVNWENDGDLIQNTFTDDGTRVRATNFNLDRVFKEGICWTVVTSGKQSFRKVNNGFLFDAAAGICQSLTGETDILVAFLNSKPADMFLAAVNPTLNLHPGYIESLPFDPGQIESFKARVIDICDSCILVSKKDWDSYEISWDFSTLPLLQTEFRKDNLNATYTQLRKYWQEVTVKMQSLEEENNQIFTQVYGLQDELSSEVSLREITLTCNPHYRYPDSSRKIRTEEEREALLWADTMREFISYAVGCMFGRYSLDKPGLILANQGETAADYRAQIPRPTFPPDEDNVIPILDEGWFTDDIAERFKRFLRLTFGAEFYAENLAFLEAAISKDIRSYFLRDFYADHLQTYKNRPIYWLFSSPRGSFNALIYMHRYRPDTVSVVLNGYLREYRVKLNAHKAHLEGVSISANADKRAKTQALKELDRLNKILAELKEYEDDILYPLATQRLEIDLDDGVRVNYAKFGKALKQFSGLGSESE